MSKIEILDNGEMWDVEPRAASDVAARFEALDEERRVHYAAMAAAGVLPEESPFEREREWEKLKGESLKLKGESLKLKGSESFKTCWRWLARRFAAAMMIFAIPAAGTLFGVMAAFAAIAEEGGF